MNMTMEAGGGGHGMQCWTQAPREHQGTTAAPVATVAGWPHAVAQTGGTLSYGESRTTNMVTWLSQSPHFF